MEVSQKLEAWARTSDKGSWVEIFYRCFLCLFVSYQKSLRRSPKYAILHLTQGSQGKPPVEPGRTVGGITQVCIEHYAEALELATWPHSSLSSHQPLLSRNRYGMCPEARDPASRSKNSACNTFAFLVPSWELVSFSLTLQVEFFSRDKPVRSLSACGRCGRD